MFGFFKGFGIERKLHKAAKVGDVSTIEKCVANGVNIEAVDEHGFTALMMASANNQTAAIEALLKAGANIEAKAELGLTALMQAARYESVEAIIALVRAGANIEAVNIVHWTALRFAITLNKIKSAEVLLKLGAKYDIIALFEDAISHGNVAGVNELIKAGVDFNAETRSGMTLIEIAIAKGEREIVKLLRQAGAQE